MNWIRKEKRLSIYLRDGLACVWCGQAVEDGIKLTLDHLIPHSQGGSNQADNLVTSCHMCNSSRGARAWKIFADVVATYRNHGLTTKQLTRYITATVKRPLDIPAAKALIAARGFVPACTK
jgi:hypothetical protein